MDRRGGNELSTPAGKKVYRRCQSRGRRTTAFNGLIYRGNFCLGPPLPLRRVVFFFFPFFRSSAPKTHPPAEELDIESLWVACTGHPRSRSTRINIVAASGIPRSSGLIRQIRKAPRNKCLPRMGYGMGTALVDTARHPGTRF